ncbi:MAG: dihydroneopterin aldolase [Gemmatimonadaceae bacterium]|jgi:dihydroneopterin aldolase|nr:dihydroneopterin aldolase [Gemmatimonadaceae bacterium]
MVAEPRRTTAVLRQVALHDLRFFVRVGILPHEAELAQPLAIDLVVWVRGGGDAWPVIDYRDLWAIADGVVSRGPLEYLEAIAEAIGEGCLARLPVERVRVAVRKPHVTLPGPLAGAEVVLEVERRA